MKIAPGNRRSNIYDLIDKKSLPRRGDIESCAIHVSCAFKKSANKEGKKFPLKDARVLDRKRERSVSLRLANLKSPIRVIGKQRVCQRSLPTIDCRAQQWRTNFELG